MKTRINNINFENVYVTDTETELLLQGDIDESVLTIDIDGEITVEILNDNDEILISITGCYENAYFVVDERGKTAVFQKVISEHVTAEELMDILLGVNE